MQNTANTTDGGPKFKREQIKSTTLVQNTASPNGRGGRRTDPEGMLHQVPDLRVAAGVEEEAERVHLHVVVEEVRDLRPIHLPSVVEDGSGSSRVLWNIQNAYISPHWFPRE